MIQFILLTLHAIANFGEFACYFINRYTSSFLFFGEPDFSEMPDYLKHSN